MVAPKNECIDARAFASLILDYEFSGDEKLGWPAYVSCRVIVDGWKKGDVIAETREEAIQKFRNNEW